MNDMSDIKQSEIQIGVSIQTALNSEVSNRCDM